ncbi:alpha/beta-hydrolase [Hypoxylon trugodes]|uniref:alpha/beta-hydrolase n=1 Tax=Hypoxylon trugodes TaxID=326681 RepID=UPI00219041B9|nr:alpha/beta-hydrolase [Hypoxylon trugodes]KAI1385561.1 alpha/beta-hydrolase [Hypoxylon trugodes]
MPGTIYDAFANPALIYDEAPEHTSLLSKPPAPLFLIHDGGGTTFNYHLLDNIDRPLWGIENAHLHKGGWWDGGIAEMAAHYVDLLAKAKPEGGDIILGGWSLGGHLSLEMAHRIALAARNGSSRGSSRSSSSRRNSTDSDSSAASGMSALSAPKFRVLGIIMIDTVYPKTLTEIRGPLPSDHVVLTPEQSKTMKLKDKVDLNMTHARMMVKEWELPRWTEDNLRVPPTILLRAKEFVNRNPNGSFVDYTRDLRLLGWDKYVQENGNFIKEIVDIDGHHFSIFSEEHLEDISQKIRDAADVVDPPDF